ncbi:hypothetical protein GW17_00011442 [Ensete ventricosum]|nr:hypothetical protein GW17_00011442 [Ensete ventricosum]
MRWVCLRSTVKLAPPEKTRNEKEGRMVDDASARGRQGMMVSARNAARGSRAAANFKATGRIDFGDEKSGRESERERASQKASLCVRTRGASRGPRKEEHKEQPTTHENKAKIWKHMHLPQCFFRTAGILLREINTADVYAFT